MPGGKAPLLGAIGWPRKLNAADPKLLLKWVRRGHPAPVEEELSRHCERISEALGHYFGYRESTPQLTQTERNRVLEKMRRGELSPDKADVNSRAIHYTGHKPRGGRRPDQLLVDLIRELAPIWQTVTGRSPHTKDHIKGERPFYSWVVELFEACKEPPPKQGSVSDILDLTKPPKIRRL
jgi:hypothetical protein